MGGQLNGYRFEALVFEEHAVVPDWELAQSRISKLWLQRIADRKPVFSWERGLDQPAADETVQRVVDFLAEGLADFVSAIDDGSTEQDA